MPDEMRRPMMLLAVAVTDIYYYNPNFYLNLGFEPKQIPVFGGFMWRGGAAPVPAAGISLAGRTQ